ncbi:hypothetical protein L0222_01580 [bacterium]|nr:hypothetical protein [bacterium]MCI0605052.1 hypothetical protein [bacterium]
MSDNRWRRIALILMGLTVFALSSEALQIRFAPGDYVYLAQDNRFLGIANLQIQNLAIINDSEGAVQLNEVLVEIWAGKNLLESEHHGGEMLEKRWSMLKKYLDLMQLEGIRLSFSMKRRSIPLLRI